MAKSPSHRFGQIIGDLLEETMIQFIKPIAQKYDLYLDYKHPRKARDNKKEVIWLDIRGNKHKLDIVLEKNGSEEKMGQPIAFIEMAWRRYTKHSKNKAQEMQGAIIPLISKYNKNAPFFGAVIAGEFTAPSIRQLKSEGFKVVYFEYESIKNAFSLVGIDAHWDEATSEDELNQKVALYNTLNEHQRSAIINKLVKENQAELVVFVNSLEKALSRKVESISVFSLHGIETVLLTLEDAYKYIKSYDELNTNVPIIKYEIIIKYSNEDKIEASFRDKQTALAFLLEYIS